MARSRGDALFYLAAAVFGLFWLSVSQTAPVLGEGVAVYPAPAAPILAAPSAEDPGPSFTDSCADPGPPRLVTSSQIRPRVALCFRGRQYPLQITSYASGVPYWVTDLLWPIHRGRVFRVRVFGLLLGLLTIALTRRLVMRFADPVSANVAALCISATPSFVWLHSSLLHHELIPWLASAAAIDQLSRDRGLSPDAAADVAGPPTGRVAAAAALVGLAMLSNVKVLFLILPLGLVALRAGVRFGAIRRGQWFLAAVILAAVVSPILVGNSANAGSDLTMELGARLGMLTQQLSFARILTEIPNLVVFWGDALIFGALASGEHPAPLILALLATIPPLFYCLISGVVYLWNGRGALVPATCGLLILTHLLVSALLYNYYVGANYMPLCAIFGVATAVTAIDGARWLTSRVQWPAAGTRNAIAGLAFGALAWGVVGRGSPASFVTMSMNGAAVRELGAYLATHPEPEVPLFVTTYVLAGIPEAVTGGTVRTIKASDYLGCASDRNLAYGPDQEVIESGRRCVQLRFERLLEAFPGPLRVLLPVKPNPIDDPLAGEYGLALELAATATGRRLGAEATFEGWDTGPLLELVRVDATATRPEKHARRASSPVGRRISASGPARATTFGGGSMGPPALPHG